MACVPQVFFMGSFAISCVVGTGYEFFSAEEHLIMGVRQKYIYLYLLAPSRRDAFGIIQGCVV